jgi:hypothetical protein
VVGSGVDGVTDWVHSRDYSLWINKSTGEWEKYDRDGSLLEKGKERND